MLQDLFIINKHGTGIAEYHATKSEFELQLVAGLLSALIEFSKATLLDSMQIIKLEHGKLGITSAEGSDLFAIGIYGQEDHDVAIKQTNRRIYNDFISQHPDLVEYETVDYDPAPALRVFKMPVVIRKDWRHAILVSIIASVFLIPLYFTNDLFANVIRYGINSNITYFSLYLGFAIPYFIIGFFISKRGPAAIMSLAINTVFSSLLLLQIILKTGYSTIPFDGLDLTYGVAMVTGFFGGYIGEFLFLKRENTIREQ